jgi:hypothetical protein
MKSRNAIRVDNTNIIYTADDLLYSVGKNIIGLFTIDL